MAPIRVLLLFLLVVFVPSVPAFAQTPSYGNGFTSTAGLTWNGYNGGSPLSGTKLRLTDGGTGEGRSVFFNTPVNVQSFTTDFSFQLTKPNTFGFADGFTFTIQNSSLAALGGGGGSLGYGPTCNGCTNGIQPSVAVGFQLYSTVLGNKEVSLTGHWTNGNSPAAVPGTSTNSSGVNLQNSGHVMKVHMTYDGTTLTWTITDSSLNPQPSFTQSVAIDIPTVVGNSTAFVGFTGGTGGYTATQDILTWTYTPANGGSQVATPTFSPAAGTYNSAQSVTISDTTSGSTIYYTTDGSNPTTSSAQFTTPISVSTTTTIKAMATASGMTNSQVAIATYTIQVATPTFSPAAGIYNSTQMVTISDTTSGSTIYYTTDGSTPTTSSTQFTNPITVSTSTTINAIAAANGMTNSQVAMATYTIQTSGGGGTPSYGSGFTSTSGLTLNGYGGSSALSGTHLRLTDGGTGEARSAFFNTQVNVQSFITDFNFQLTSASADGFTFAIQGNSPTALGAGGGSLGYGPNSSGPGIGSSVAVKFDLYSNAGEGSDSTGLYTDGASPTIPAVDMSSSGVNLHSSDVMSAHLAYDGTTLTLIVKDTSTNKTFRTTFSVNIPNLVGGNTAYVGFTGGTGGLSATQDILTWTYNAVPVAAFSWPVHTQTITEAPSACGGANDYSTYCLQTPINGQYHTGIDVCPSSGCPANTNPISDVVNVFASSSGVVEIALVTPDPTQTLCDGSATTGYKTNTSNLGNVIVIAHPNGRFSLYGHLDCIANGIVPGSVVDSTTHIGNMGHSGDGDRDRTFIPHTHFELKDKSVTGDPSNQGYSGYTPDLPDGWGYHDARTYINPFAGSPISPTAVQVVANSAQTIRTGPDTSFASLGTIAPGQEFVAFATTGSWYQIHLPNSNAKISGWVQGGQTLVAPDSGATVLQVSGASSSGLTIQPGPSSSSNLVDWNATFNKCTPTAKIWNGQEYVSAGSQNGFNEFYLPLNFYLNSANACGKPSGPGPNVGWASSTFLH